MEVSFLEYNQIIKFGFQCCNTSAMKGSERLTYLKVS